MQIRVNQSVAGAEYSFTPGVYTVGEGQMTEAIAHEALTCGWADAVRSEAEVATAPAPEVAVARGRRAGGRGHRSQPDGG